MPDLVSTNNFPNAKVYVPIAVAAVAGTYEFIGPYFHLPVIPHEIIVNNLEGFFYGLLGLIFIIGYLKKPHAGDGVKPKE